MVNYLQTVPVITEELPLGVFLFSSLQDAGKKPGTNVQVVIYESCGYKIENRHKVGLLYKIRKHVFLCGDSDALHVAFLYDRCTLNIKLRDAGK